MATYVFKCLKCSKEGTHSMPMADASFSMKLECEPCGIKTLQKQLIKETKPVHFKGHGWVEGKSL